MPPVFRINPTGTNAEPKRIETAESARLLKAEEWAIFCAAEELLRKAGEEAGRIKLEAGAAYAEEKRRGYADGQEEGRLELAEHMLDTVGKALDYLESLEGDMVTLVTEAIKKILGDLPHKDIVSGVVRKALSLAQSQRRVTLRVSVQDKPAVQEQLAALMREYASIEFAEVIDDARLKPGDCLLESELGVIDAGLATQIKAISNTLEKRQKG
jgi:type III secretion protein L